MDPNPFANKPETDCSPTLLLRQPRLAAQPGQIAMPTGEEDGIRARRDGDGQGGIAPRVARARSGAGIDAVSGRDHQGLFVGTDGVH